MTKGQFNIRIETNVWESAQERFPRQLSPMIEEFLMELVSSDMHEGVSREELTAKLIEAKQQKRKIEAAEKALQMQISTYDDIVEKRKEALESETAEENKERYMQLPDEIRVAVAEICQKVSHAKYEGYEQPLYPFNFYFDIIKEPKQFSKLMKLAEDDNNFELFAIMLDYKNKKKKLGEI